MRTLAEGVGTVSLLNVTVPTDTNRQTVDWFTNLSPSKVHENSAFLYKYFFASDS